MHSARRFETRGFTLIELLVVITIISLLLLIGLAVYSNVGPRSRDAKRKEDLRAIAQSLEIYYNANKRYPRTSGACCGSPNLSSTANWWIDDTGTPIAEGQIPYSASFIETLPKDPKLGSGNPFISSNSFNYAYWAGPITCSGWTTSDSGQYFILVATLENQSDNERNVSVTEGGSPGYKNCTGATIIATTGPNSNPSAFVVTSPQ